MPCQIFSIELYWYIIASNNSDTNSESFLIRWGTLHNLFDLVYTFRNSSNSVVTFLKIMYNAKKRRKGKPVERQRRKVTDLNDYPPHDRRTT
jgi:hypothetical protein